MHPTVRIILAILSGILLGSVVNMGIINLSGSIIPPPNGADLTTVEGITSAMHLMEPKHFLMPFLAHAFGTITGAFVAALITKKNEMSIAMFIGVVFLLGGIASVMMLPSPLWFTLTDLIVAYLPMAYIGARLAALKKIK
jgi:hypothetical protein